MSKHFKAPGMIMGLFVTSTAVAHTGHGHGGGGSSLLHYLSDPLHMVAGLSLAAALFAAILWARYKRPGSRRLYHDKSG